MADAKGHVRPDDERLAGCAMAAVGGTVTLHWRSFVLHSTDYHRPETLDIDGRVAITSSPQILRDIGNGQGPRKSLIAFGYAGWGAGQLEGELSRGDWLTAEDEEKLATKTGTRSGTRR